MVCVQGVQVCEDVNFFTRQIGGVSIEVRSLTCCMNRGQLTAAVKCLRLILLHKD